MLALVVSLSPRAVARRFVLGRVALAGGMFVVAAGAISDARAAGPPSPGPSSPGPSAAPPAETDATPGAKGGLAVLALTGAEDAAWPLAQAVYATDALRPPRLDEAHARILAGAPPAAGAGVASGAGAAAGADAASGARDARDLEDTRAAIHGDDAPSRALLASIARTFRVRGIVVVEMRRDTAERAVPFARVFLRDAGVFDAARYEPDADDTPRDAGPSASVRRARWSGATLSLARFFSREDVAAADAPSRAAPALATGAVPLPREGGKAEGATSHAFYTSPWFWGAVGAAAFGGAAVYFATRDNSGGAIHLQLQVPK